MTSSKEFVLTHLVKNVSKMSEGAHNYCEKEEHFGVSWKMIYLRKDGSFSIYINCENKTTQTEWSIKTFLTLKVSSVTGKKTISQCEGCFEGPFNNNSSWGLDVVEWNEMEKDYLVDDDLIIEAHVKILKITGIEKKTLRKFDKSMEQFSDVVLTVNDEKFYVLKLYLASQSTYFQAMFLQEFKESEKADIKLEGVDAKDFQNFLELLYGECPISDETVDGIIQLADMYNAIIAVRKCEEYLVKESEKTLKEKFRMAKQYNLENLKNSCLSKIKTVEDIRSVLASDLNEMDRSVVQALFQKSLEIHKFC